MDWREFVANVVGSLAWPVALVLLIVFLRREIGGLLGGSLRHLKIGPGGFKAEWDRQVEVTAASSARALPSPQGPEVEREMEAIEALVDTTPVVAVRRCFDVVQRELRRVILEHGIALAESPNPPPASYLIWAAQNGGAITGETGEALSGLDTLARLTDMDPNGTQFTPAQAREFVALARTVLYVLDAP